MVAIGLVGVVEEDVRGGLRVDEASQIKRCQNFVGAAAPTLVTRSVVREN